MRFLRTPLINFIKEAIYTKIFFRTVLDLHIIRNEVLERTLSNVKLYFKCLRPTILGFQLGLVGRNVGRIGRIGRPLDWIPKRPMRVNIWSASKAGK